MAAPHLLHGLEISPTVALALAAAMARSSRLPWPGAGRLAERLQRRRHRGWIALGLEALQLGDLAVAHGLVVDLQHLDFGLIGRPGTC